MTTFSTLCWLNVGLHFHWKLSIYYIYLFVFIYVFKWLPWNCPKPDTFCVVMFLLITNRWFVTYDLIPVEQDCVLFLWRVVIHCVYMDLYTWSIPGFDHIQDIMSTCTITENGILQKPHHNRDTQVYVNIVIMFFHAGDNVLFSSCCCLSPGQVCVVAVWPDSLAAPCLQMNEEHSGTQRHSWCRSEVILTVMIHTQLGAHGQYIYKTENREALI